MSSKPNYTLPPVSVEDVIYADYVESNGQGKRQRAWSKKHTITASYVFVDMPDGAPFATATFFGVNRKEDAAKQLDAWLEELNVQERPPPQRLSAWEERVPGAWYRSARNNDWGMFANVKEGPSVTTTACVVLGSKKALLNVSTPGLEAAAVRSAVDAFLRSIGYELED